METWRHQMENRKRKPRRFSLSVYRLVIVQTKVCRLVCPFVDDETNRSYQFAFGLKRTCPSLRNGMQWEGSTVHSKYCTVLYVLTRKWKKERCRTGKTLRLGHHLQCSIGGRQAARHTTTTTTTTAGLNSTKYNRVPA
jgi:hypothetical protein